MNVSSFLNSTTLYICGSLILVVVLGLIVSSMARRGKYDATPSKGIVREVRSSVPVENYQNKPAESLLHVSIEKSTTNLETSGNVFISYRRSDSADVAGRIYDRLTDKFGRGPIFKDVDSIPLGYDFKEYLDKKVSECKVLLAIIGDSWANAKDSSGKKRLDDPGDFVRIEIESALARGIPVIPLLVRGASMPSEEQLPPSLRKLVYRNGIPIRVDPDFHNDMNRLITSLEKYLQ